MPYYYSFFRSHTSTDLKKITSLTNATFSWKNKMTEGNCHLHFLLLWANIPVPMFTQCLWSTNFPVTYTKISPHYHIFSRKQWNMYFSSRNTLKEVSTNNPNKYNFHSFAIMNSNQWWTEFYRPTHWRNAILTRLAVSP